MNEDAEEVDFKTLSTARLRTTRAQLARRLARYEHEASTPTPPGWDAAQADGEAIYEMRLRGLLEEAEDEWHTRHDSYTGEIDS